jgi:hypothetical protein
MNYSFAPAARLEFHQAIVYYEQCREGLGGEFADSVGQTIERIMKNPAGFPPAAKKTRRCRTEVDPRNWTAQ